LIIEKVIIVVREGVKEEVRRVIVFLVMMRVLILKRSLKISESW
jgi:hypothetical protein